MWLVALSAYFIKLTLTTQSTNGTNDVVLTNFSCVNPTTKDQFVSLIYNRSCNDCQFVLANAEADRIVHSCGAKFKPPRFAPLVHLMNASMFTNQQDGGKNQSAGAAAENAEDWCMIVNFYAPYCPFSARLAPFYNALPRVFPTLFVAAVDATQNSKINLVYGISGTPTLLLFHNGRPVARFETGTYGVKNLVDFIMKHTDLDPIPDIDVQDEDLLGPLPSTPVKTVDYYLIIAWFFIILSSFYYVCKSSFGQRLFETLRRNWREMDEE